MGRAGVDGCAISVASLSTPYISNVDEGENVGVQPGCASY